MITTSNRMREWAILVFVCFCFSSSNSQANLTIGSVIDTVPCLKSEHQKYALYLPTAYDDNKSWPIIYFFEPAARGSLPVSLYKDIAEEFGFILVGSHNSRNGPLTVGEETYQSIRKDTEERFNINQDAIILSGFSGGGRFSQYLSSKNTEVDGVICVAGPKSKYSEDFPSEKDDWKYAAIVGNKDFNYLEHKLWQKELQLRGIDNHLTVYDATHMWPPADKYKKPLNWISVSLGLRNFAPYLKNRFTVVDSLIETDIWQAYQDLLEIEKMTKSDSDQKNIREYHERIKSNKKFKKAQKQNERLITKEIKEQKRLSKAMFESEGFILNPSLFDYTEYTIDFWKREVKSLNRKSKKKGKEGELYQRLSGHIGILIHGIANKSNESKTYHLSLFANKVNMFLNPKSVWHHWQRAIIYAKMDNKKKALKFKKKASKIDIEEFNNILSAPYWENLRKDYPYLFSNSE